MIKHREGDKKDQNILFSIETWIKRHWLYLAGGVFFIIASSLGLLAFALYTPNELPSDQSDATATSTEDISLDGLKPRCLDGVLVPSEYACLLPRAVMIENQVDARPLAGIVEASLVFEAPVEGGITRLMAVFDATTTVSEIGPVRSARPYHVEWAQALNAIFAHVGGSPEALNRIGGLMDFKNLDEMAGEKYFWRSKSRSAPHNVFTSSENLNLVQEKKQWSAESFTPWIFTDQDQDFTAGEIREITLPYSGSYKVKWVYDEDLGMYERHVGGRSEKDKQGNGVYYKNILVLVTEERTLDNVGRLFIRTTGSGKAYYFSAGEVVEAVWSRNAGGFYSLKTADGRDVAFLRGNTWIHIASSPKYEPVY
jgi:hypothetical protein